MHQKYRTRAGEQQRPRHLLSFCSLLLGMLIISQAQNSCFTSRHHIHLPGRRKRERQRDKGLCRPNLTLSQKLMISIFMFTDLFPQNYVKQSQNYVNYYIKLFLYITSSYILLARTELHGFFQTNRGQKGGLSCLVQINYGSFPVSSMKAVFCLHLYLQCLEEFLPQKNMLNKFC